MNNTDNTNYRYEYKYTVSAAQIEILKSKLRGLMFTDSNAMNGAYHIRSLYFDNYYNKCFFENLNSEEPRQKYRIRIYNKSDDLINLEIKRKEHGRSLKWRTNINKNQAIELLKGKYISENSDNDIIKKVNSKIMTELYHPISIVDYTRHAYEYKFGNVRVTFDTNISSSNQINRFFDENIIKRPILQKGLHLMEVKFNEYLPDVIFNTLQLENLNIVTFSKYFLSRKYSL